MAYDLILKGGTLVTGSESALGDIAFKNGKIAAIGDLGQSQAAEVRSIVGLHVMPGGIDTQVHFREPGLEHKEDLESGTRAAIWGGITSILEMPNTNPNTDSEAHLNDKLNRAKGRAWSNYGFFVGATTENIESLGQFENLPGTPGIKIFMGSSTGSLLVGDDENLRKVLQKGRKRTPIHAEDEPRNRDRKSLISNHPHAREHPFLRDAESAILATRRILALSKETGRPIHILHISTADEVGIITEAKGQGVDVTMEVTPQHLFFSAPDCYDRLGSLAQMNPPIRSKEHTAGIWRGLEAGAFAVFGSDHAPHTLEEKSQPYPQSPSGMPGVQTMLSVLLTFVNQGRLSFRTVVRMLCENPAKLYGIKGKGRLEVGYDADIAVVDLLKSRKVDKSILQSKCGWSPYGGEILTGWTELVYVNGVLTFDSESVVGDPIGQQLEFDGERGPI